MPSTVRPLPGSWKNSFLVLGAATTVPISDALMAKVCFLDQSYWRSTEPTGANSSSIVPVRSMDAPPSGRRFQVGRMGRIERAAFPLYTLKSAKARRRGSAPSLMPPSIGADEELLTCRDGCRHLLEAKRTAPRCCAGIPDARLERVPCWRALSAALLPARQYTTVFCGQRRLQQARRSIVAAAVRETDAALPAVAPAWVTSAAGASRNLYFSAISPAMQGGAK
mmetsp:Transcript_40420/g.114462  ORF Transcript_40420/g.114462 Transcript_40420/m.114462 type:complete len:224 (+) Transcript_40420:652-1323(+)